MRGTGPLWKESVLLFLRQEIGLTGGQVDREGRVVAVDRLPASPVRLREG